MINRRIIKEHHGNENTIYVRIVSVLLSLYILLGVMLLFAACSEKQKTWRCYGDYYSFDEGFRYDGKEYHEQMFFLRYGPMHRSFGVKVKDSLMTLVYQSYSLSSQPFGPCDAELSFDLTIDSCLFCNGKKWEMVSKNHFYKLDNPVEVGIVHFKHNSIPDNSIHGWMSFTLGHRYYEGSYNYYYVDDLSFEFELWEPDESVSGITEGYIRGKPEIDNHDF